MSDAVSAISEQVWEVSGDAYARAGTTAYLRAGQIGWFVGVVTGIVAGLIIGWAVWGG